MFNRRGKGRGGGVEGGIRMLENWGLKQDARAKGKGLRNAVIGKKKYV